MFLNFNIYTIYFKLFYNSPRMMNEAEAERRFQEDLEKAKALSMESQALDEFR